LRAKPAPSISGTFVDAAGGLKIVWSAELRDESNYVVESLELTADKACRISDLIFVGAAVKGARQVGQVDGSVVVVGDVFLAVEHPLATNTVTGDARAPQVRIALPRGNTLQPGGSWFTAGRRGSRARAS